MKTRLLFLSICSLLSLSLDAESELFFGPVVANAQLDSKNTAIFHGAAVGGIIGYQYTQPMDLFARAYVSGNWDIQITPYYNIIKTGKSTAYSSDGILLGIQKQTYQIYGGSFGFSYFF